MDGLISAWIMDGTTPLDFIPIFQISDANWDIVGTGDLNGDGKPDILFRHKLTGDNVVLFMDGSIPLSFEVLKKEPDTNWKIMRGQ